MEIEYLTHLVKHPSVTRPSGYVKQLKPISMDEIISLENTYNGGKPFPKALRENIVMYWLTIKVTRQKCRKWHGKIWRTMN